MERDDIRGMPYRGQSDPCAPKWMIAAADAARHPGQLG